MDLTCQTPPIGTPQSARRSLRVRTISSSTNSINGSTSDLFNEIKLCPSVMSPETKKMLPPTTETIMTKPFPIRGESIYYHLYRIFHISI